MIDSPKGDLFRRRIQARLLPPKNPKKRSLMQGGVNDVKLSILLTLGSPSLTSASGPASGGATGSALVSRPYFGSIGIDANRRALLFSIPVFWHSRSAVTRLIRIFHI